MQTDQLLSEYKYLLNILSDKKDKFTEDKISVFNFAKGNRYNNDLLIVGRSVNGWNTIDKNQVANAFEEVKSNIENDNLQWVIDKWGVNDKSYNTAKSSFWRVARTIAESIIGNKENVISYLSWTNLYKVSKHDGGNPSGSLMNIQFDSCKRILELEINLLQPRNIVFLTGIDWAGDFLQGDDFKPLNFKAGFTFVAWAGWKGDVAVVVGKHPQGKPETAHGEEILKALEILKR